MNMWIAAVITITLLLTTKCARAQRGDLYEIPVPEIVTFTTGGFRISIPENFGITEFRFHGNVNEEIRTLRPGMINIETQERNGRNWILETSRPFLKKDDYICYWIFVKRDRLGYVRQPNYFKVKELVPYFAVNTTASNVPTFADSTTKKPWIHTVDEEHINTDELKCQNNTESVTMLQKQVESLNKTVDILMKVVEKLPDAKRLTVSGKILQNENPAATVRFVLWDKLDLKPNIISAVRNNDGSITFELETLEEKIEILKLAQDKLYNEDTYSIPEPEIQAFTPKGFRVSVDDAPGIRLFAFHGNINRELRDLEAGVFSRDILHKRNGKWTFEDRKTRLQVGDVIHYWLFVIKDELGYRLDDGRFEVKELIPSPFNSSTPQQNRYKPNKDQAGLANCSTPQQPSVTPFPDHDRDAFLRICELTVLNATQALLSFQSQVDALRETNQQLMELIEKYPDGKKITISGRIPVDEPVTTAKFIIREKLDLNPAIVSAVRNSDNSITVELATLSEKLKIFKVAKEKLKNTRIIIV